MKVPDLNSSYNWLFYLMQRWAWDTKRTKAMRRSYVCGFKSFFNAWLWLNKYCCLAVPAYHTRYCVIKCLQMKKQKKKNSFYTRDHRSNSTFSFTYSSSLIKVYFFQRFYKRILCWELGFDFCFVSSLKNPSLLVC